MTDTLSSSLIRCALWPKIIEEDVFAPEQLFSGKYLSKNKATAEIDWELSVGLGHLLTSIENVHDYGCRTAEKARNAARESGRSADVHYIGFYELKRESVEAISNDVYHVFVVPSPKEGLAEHGDIALKVKVEGIRKTVRADAKTLIMSQLANLMFGGEGHICACDEPVRKTIEVSPFPRYQGGRRIPDT